MVQRSDVGQMVRVRDHHGPYSGEVGKLDDFDAGPTYSSGFIRFEDGTGAWLSARWLTVDETQHPLHRPKEV